MDGFIEPRNGTRPRHRGGIRIVFLAALACLCGSATCFTLSILPASALSRLRVLGALGPAPSRSSGSKPQPAALQALSLHDSHSRRSNPGSSAPQDTRRIAGMYGLVKDPKDAHKDSERDPYRVQQVKLDAHVTRICTAIMENRTAAGTALRNLSALSSLAVAVELRSHSKDRRTFVLPGNITVRLRERSYSQSGLGGSLWGSGIGLSILLGKNCQKVSSSMPGRVQGKLKD